MKKTKRKFKNIQEMKAFLKDIGQRNAVAIKRYEVEIKKDEKRLSESLVIVSEPRIKYKSKLSNG